MNERYREIASTLPAELDALPQRRGFRLRGMQMTRLETFTDAAFAFAVSMSKVRQGASNRSMQPTAGQVR